MNNIKEKNEYQNNKISSSNNKREEKRYLSENRQNIPKSQKYLDKPNLKLPYMKLNQSISNNLKINNLLNLEPFFSDFNNNMDKKGKEILREIASEYRDEKYEINKVVFRYGDEADKFYIINEGEVSLYFPFTEIINMNIDEFFIYILRLRRYNEIEMLNDVLLLNNGEFMKEFDEGFQIDDYIYKLYTTYLKLIFDPTFLNHTVTKKRKIQVFNNYNNYNILPIKNNDNNKIKKEKLSSHKRRRINYYYEEEKEIDINIFDTFNDKGLKELLLRIGEELIETMKWIMPEKMCNIIEEKDEDDIMIKKLKYIPKKLIEKYQKYDPNIINEHDYYKRIMPIKQHNINLVNKKMIIMKYLYIGTLKKGECFGDFNSDSLSLFSHKYISIARNSLLGLNLHKYQHFRNMTAISTISKKRIENKVKLHLFSFNKKIFSNHFSKYVERKNFDKKRFLLNNPLFLNTNNKNLLRTYSICFKEKNISEGEYIIREKEKLCESDIFISFIIKGEFESNCVKTISQIDEIIKIIGNEHKIKDTYSDSSKKIINTPFYDELVNRPINLRLNYMNKNDIIGLIGVFRNDEYFNNVICTRYDSKIYKVDARIIKLLIDSDPVVNDNKNSIVYNKYQMLSDTLLRQRKMFFDSFINIDKIQKIDNIIRNNTNNNDNKKDNYNNVDKYKTINLNYKPFPRKILLVNSLSGNLSPLSKKIPLSPQNKNIIKPSRTKHKFNFKSKHKKEEDLDQMLAGLSRILTLRERRKEKHLEFEKKYKEKMELLEKVKKLKKIRKEKLFSENIEYLKGRNKNSSFCDFEKSNTLYNEVYKFLPSLKKKENKKYESEYDLVFHYKKNPLLIKSMSTSEINPLFYDDFNRSFNTSQYFNIKFDEENSENRSIDKKYNREYNIQFKSGIKLVKKQNKFTKNDAVTQRLRNIYRGKFDKILYDNKKLI